MLLGTHLPLAQKWLQKGLCVRIIFRYVLTVLLWLGLLLLFLGTLLPMLGALPVLVALPNKHTHKKKQKTLETKTLFWLCQVGRDDNWLTTNHRISQQFQNWLTTGLRIL